MRSIKINKNPFLLFSPFLLLYIVLVLIFPTQGTMGDENRYLMFAQNLIHGFYSPPAPGIDIGDGPGYPILLMPFLALNLPLICIALANPIMYYLSIILLFKAIQQVVSFRIAFIFSLFWACFYNSYENMPLILPEAFTAFLISLLVFNLLAAFNPVNSKKTKKYIYLSGFIIGYIALTKLIFGYVLAFMVIGSGLLCIINRKNENPRKALIILLIAITTTAPYLIYTYHLTGRIFYWGTSGGENLYWMSTPYKGEYGSWAPYPILKHDSVNLIGSTGYDRRGGQLNNNNRINDIPGSNDSIKSHHQENYKEINKYKGVEKDDAYKRIAIYNIKSHPVKYLENCFSNIGRILFNYPYSYSFQKAGTLLRLPLTGTIVVFMLFCLVPTFMNWRKIIFPIRFLLFFVLLYLGGSVLASAETRMFTVIVPILLFWMAFIIQKSIKINIKEW
jgi:4-amino-4-deoxy-L-arabinose transferase-like glycosyltransferase